MNQPIQPGPSPAQASPPVQASPATPERARGWRRGMWIGIGFAVVGVIVGIWGFWLASQWQDRAEQAEDEYRQVADALGLSESDNQALVQTQQELAAAKAAVEDQRVALEEEKALLQDQSDDLAASLDVVAAVARQYNECSAGYSRVIQDLANDQVTNSTVQTANSADAACTEADRLAQQLP